ncbi:hypothetical protein ACIQ6Y_32325 [Streptomyces sp. NPDC096205]|uniref:hypothetical protein n=1 Tax=Streptomyces sp. NPDC096205 TaxID=3366081 RepID=UPI00380E4927
MPPFEPTYCRYITEWAHVKTRYHLTVDQREKNALADYAAPCPNVPITTQPPR